MSSSRSNRVNLRAQLWHACAGPTAKLPRVGDRVFYFPQAHLHQVEVYMKEEGTSNNIPSYGLPSKILCYVVRVDLKVEVDTDEVFAKIVLVPDFSEGQGSKSFQSDAPEKIPATFFRKKLTPSDVCTHGGCSLHKKHVEQTFPPLDMSQGTASQELVVNDLHGKIYNFLHICRGTPRRHLLTTNWGKFVEEKRLKAGDICIFIRGTYQLYVGVHRAVRLHRVSTGLSTTNVEHGILLSAFEAVRTRTDFSVYYHPRISPSGVVVDYDQFMESMKVDFSPGTRVQMILDGGGENPEHNLKKFSGTIIGQEDVDPTKWPRSEWHSLKVCWDATSSGCDLPNRVSPWSIQSLESTVPHQQSLGQQRSMPFNPMIRYNHLGGSQGQGEGTWLTIPKVNIPNPSCEDESNQFKLFGVKLGYSNTGAHVTTPSYIKVLKYGASLGRCVDISRFSGYKDLVCVLDMMFDFQGMLVSGKSGWHVSYDAHGNGNKKLLGNLPWVEFKGVVQKMYICPNEKVPRWNHSG